PGAGRHPARGDRAAARRAGAAHRGGDPDGISARLRAGLAGVGAAGLEPLPHPDEPDRERAVLQFPGGEPCRDAVVAGGEPPHPPPGPGGGAQDTGVRPMADARRNLKIAVALLLVVLLGYLALRPGAIELDTAIASVGPLQVTVGDEGQTRSRHRHLVTDPVPGRIERIALEVGDS